jgi:hypothetical protein
VRAKRAAWKSDRVAELQAAATVRGPQLRSPVEHQELLGLTGSILPSGGSAIIRDRGVPLQFWSMAAGVQLRGLATVVRVAAGR